MDVGSSYVPSEICSAFLFAQLEMLDQISQQRRVIHQRYRKLLKPLEGEGLLRLPVTPEDCLGNFHLFYILLPDRQTRDGLLAHLNQNGIHAVFHYVPLHSSPMGRSFGYSEGDLPVTEELSSRLVRLPMYYEITEEEQRRVARQVAEYVRAARVEAVGNALLATSATNPPGSEEQRHDLSPAGAL